MSVDAVLAQGPVFLAGIVTGAFLTALAATAAGAVLLARQASRRTALEAELAAERRVSSEREAAFVRAQEQLEARFGLLADRVLDRTNRRFLKLAEARLRIMRATGGAELAAGRRELEALVGPIRETLAKTQAQLREVEHDRRAAFGALERHLELLAGDHRALRGETRRLVQALRRPEVRGRWGELTLRRLVELAGMVPHCDFSEQVHRDAGEIAVRPDLVVHLPDGRDVVVDAKAPLDAYLAAQEAGGDDERDQALAQHARQVRSRVRELAGKRYWEQFPRAPDFVVLFLPGEQFLAAALDRDPSLLEDALEQRVILASPTSLVGLLRAIAFGWRQLKLVENAAEIRALAERFHQRIGRFALHAGRVSRSLRTTVEQFNRAVGAFQRQVVPAARRLAELGVGGPDAGEGGPEPVDTPVRPG